MEEMSNEIMKEVFDKVNGNMRKFHDMMCKLNNKDVATVNITSLYWRAKQAISEMKKLKKFNDKTSYQTFCRKRFQFPRPMRKRKLVVSSDDKLKKRKKDDDCNVIDCSASVEHLTNEINRLRAKIRRIGVFRLNQKLKRNAETIARLNKVIKDLKTSVRSNKHQNNYVKTAENGVQCNTLKTLLNNMQTEIDELKCEIDEKNNETNNTEKKILNFRHDTKGQPYNSGIRQLYYQFRSRNIPLEHISPIIRAVLSLVDVEVGDLPSITTAAKLTYEMGTIAQNQLFDELHTCNNITMHRDATTKKGRHFYGVEFSTKDKTMTAGLREVHDGKGETYVSATDEIISDIDRNNYEHNNIDSNSSLIKHVTNFMTDRSSTEQKVNNILIKNIDCINPINSFKCSVHPLLQFSDVCTKEILTIEKDFLQMTDTTNKESSTLKLLKSVSKLFFKDGTGDPLTASTFLKTVGITELPIMNFRGNRFNTLFHNSAGTYFLKNHLATFIRSYKLPNSLNFNQTCIIDGILDKNILPIIRSLGIISKFITEPYWHFAGDETNSALDMPSVYVRLVKVFDICSKEPEMAVKGNISLFYGPHKVNQIVNSLLEPTDYDARTCEVLGKFCRLLKCKSEHLFSEYLPGGRYCLPTETEIEIAKSCPSNNITVERLMGKLDYRLKSCPNLSTASVESSIMFKNNSTGEWLSSKSEEQKEKIVTNARLNNTLNMKTIKERKKILFNKHVQKLKEKEETVKNFEEKKEKRVKTAISTVENNGLWEGRDEIILELEKMKTKKEKIALLKSQINIYKTLYTIKDKTLLQFSRKGKPLEIPKLLENILKLIQIRKSDVTPVSNSSDSIKPETVSVNNNNISKMPLPDDLNNIVGKTFFYIWSDAGTDCTWKGVIGSYNNDEFEVNIYNIQKLLTVHF